MMPAKMATQQTLDEAEVALAGDGFVFGGDFVFLG